MAGVPAASAADPASIRWDYEADVVILGGGCTGLHAAIRARDLGASVLVLEQNYDLGGRMAHSAGVTSLGGGDPIQERDRTASDPQNMGLSAPLVAPGDLDDNADTLFRDMTDWSVVDGAAAAPYRMNDRDQQRAHADNAPKVRQLQLDNYVRFSRIVFTHAGGGMSRARAPFAVMRLTNATDVRAGTISREDLGSIQEERSSPFNPANPPDNSAASQGAPGWFYGGFAIARPLEFSAREKGVQFILNRHMDELIREQPFEGRVLGVRASYSPRFYPNTTKRLESYWRNGNIEDTRETIHVRARKAVIVGTGGYHENRVLRAAFDARLGDPSIQGGGRVLMGQRAADGSGIIAGMKIGAGLGGLMLGANYLQGQPTIVTNLGTSACWDSVFPGHPTFADLGGKGVDIRAEGLEYVIGVNQVGKRFYNESQYPVNLEQAAAYPPGRFGTRNPFTPGDWRNASIGQVRSAYSDRRAAVAAALAVNEGSTAPHYWSGPIWAIFDAAAAAQHDWGLHPPYIADPPDGFFFKADTIAELAQKVMGNEHQTMPLIHLEETVARYNAFADAGYDADFEKPVMHRIDTPPFYAAIIPISMHESFGGLNINGKSQVLDLEGKVILGLYAGGEVSGGGLQHGIGRASVQGYIAATYAAEEEAR